MPTKILMSTLILLSLSNLSLAADWQLADNKQGIKTYLMDNPNSAYKSSKGQVTIKAPAKQIAEALEDTDHACKWLYSCKVFKIIEKKDKEYWSYGQTKMPWPTSDRDVILYSVVKEKPNGTITITMTAEPNKLPKEAGYVRVSKVEGLWQFEPIDKQTTLVSYQAAIDPSGDIPAWLANQYVLDSPFETLKSLRTYMETGKIKE